MNKATLIETGMALASGALTVKEVISRSENPWIAGIALLAFGITTTLAAVSSDKGAPRDYSKSKTVNSRIFPPKRHI